MYGCANQKADRLKERIFPLLFSKNSENFSFNNCNFVVQKARESTARVVMWKEFNLINSFTLESTFCGPSEGRYQDCHFTIAILKECGMLFCKTLIDYASNEPKVREVIRELETMFPSPKPEESGGLSQHFNNNVDNGDDDKKKGNGRDKKKSSANVKGGKDSTVGGKGNDKGGGRAEFSNVHMNAMANGYSAHDGNGKYEEQKKQNGKEKHTSNHAGPNYGAGAKKRMKSKKSGGVKSHHDG